MVLLIFNLMLFNPLFSWIIGGGSGIYLLLPRLMCEDLLFMQARYDEWKSDFTSFGSRKVEVNINYKRAFWVSKIAAFIVFVICAIDLLFHYNVF